jgi:hypothetical protein
VIVFGIEMAEFLRNGDDLGVLVWLMLACKATKALHCSFYKTEP